MMREDIKGPRKLAAKADMIWQSASDRSVNVVPAASPPGQVPEEAALNTLSKSSSPSYFPCCSLSWSTYCPSSCSILLSELRPLLVPPQPPRPSSTLPPPLLLDSSLLSRLFNSPSHCWGGHLSLALGPVPILSSLDLNIFPGSSSLLPSLFPSLAPTFSDTMLSS